MKRNQRKHFFINKALQGHYIVYILAVLSAVAIASALCIYFGIWSSILDNFDDASIKSRLELSTHLRGYNDARTEMTQDELTLSMIKEIELFSTREREILNEILRNTYKELIPLLLLLFMALAWGSVYVTHKIAGPLYRFHNSLKEVEKGKLNFRVQLRKHDEAQFIVPAFNACLMKLDNSLAHIKALASELTGKINPKDKECRELAQKIQDAANTYTTSRGPK